MGWKEDLIELGESRGYFTIVKGRIDYPHANKNYQWEPEEETRAAVYTELVAQHHYPIDRIRFEVNMPAQDKPADVVVYSDDACTEPFLAIELKKVGCTNSEFSYCCDQLHRNGNALRAKFGAAIAGENRRRIWQLEEFPPNERTTNRVGSLPVAYADPDALWYKKGIDNQELASLSRRDLIKRFDRCHQILWENGRRTPEICLYEMSKIIFAKFNDEKYTSPGEYYTFQRGRRYSDNDTAERVRALFQDMCNKVPGIFAERKIDVPNERLALIADKLQDARLYHSVFDPMGQAFDAYIGTYMRGPLGQFFTPRDIVDFMIYLTEPSLDDHVLDPACGTGGFLLRTYDYVIAQVMQTKSEPENAQQIIYDFANYHLQGIELNPHIARMGMTSMVVRNDGHSNIEQGDALEWCESSERFSLILTNPPFGGEEIASTRPYFAKYEFGSKLSARKRKRQRTEILFVELCLRLLKDGGRMAIVLPEGLLDGRDRDYVALRRYVESNARILAVVSLPDTAFALIGVTNKTSVVYLRKLTEKERVKRKQTLSEVQEKLQPELKTELQIIQNKAKEQVRKELVDEDFASKCENRALHGSKSAQELFEHELQRRVERMMADDVKEAMQKHEEKVTLSFREEIDYPVFQAQVEYIGYDNVGDETINDLPAVLAAWDEFRMEYGL